MVYSSGDLFVHIICSQFLAYVIIRMQTLDNALKPSLYLTACLSLEALNTNHPHHPITIPEILNAFGRHWICFRLFIFLCEVEQSRVCLNFCQTFFQRSISRSMNIIEQNRTLILYPLSEDIGRFLDRLSYDKKLKNTSCHQRRRLTLSHTITYDYPR